ncbi:hypothetical protein ACP4OV_025355 [Aristida adscensionis]
MEGKTARPAASAGPPTPGDSGQGPRGGAPGPTLPRGPRTPEAAAPLPLARLAAGRRGLKRTPVHSASPPSTATRAGHGYMAVGVAAPAIGAGAGGEAPLEAAAKEDPPLVVEREGEGAAVEGAPAAAAITVGAGEGKEEEEEEEAGLEGAPVAITAEGEERKQGGHGDKDAEEEVKVEGEGEKWLKHYSSMQSILLVGDGDFSFSLALATAFGSGANLVATSLDTHDVLRGKYSKAESNIMELKRLGATVLHGVDAKKMRFHTDLKTRKFDRIVFNFPHAGFKGKEDDMHLINLHKELLWGFFCNARHLVRRYGGIHVTHKIGYPYDGWDLEHLAFECSLVMITKVLFQKEDYPGYNQKRGDSARSDEPFDLGVCYTFKFQIGDLKKLKKLNGNRLGSITNLNIHPGLLVTDTGPFHPFPPVEAWHRRPFPPPVDAGGMLMPPPPHMHDQRLPPGFPLNSDGIVRDPYFQQSTIRPMMHMPGPWPDAVPGPCEPCDIPPPMDFPRPNLRAPQEQPWYQQRTVDDPPGRDEYSYFAGEYQRSLQREHELQRPLMPYHSAFLEHRHRERENAQKQEWLRMMVALYGRQ